MEIRCVEWVDSMGGSRWEPLDTIKSVRPMHIFTVGFVVAESDEHVTILQSYDERTEGQPHGDNYICIPTFAIKGSKVLVGT